MSADTTYAALKARQRAERGGYPPSIAVRIHRALSWLGRAERCGKDNDARFIFLWIAFNAGYANEIVGEGLAERRIFRNFIERLVELDDNNLLADLVWTEFPGAIRNLLNNPFVFEPFWDFHRGNIGEAEWKKRFAAKKSATTRALSRNNTAGVLTGVFSSLYVLRNQMMHGGATWNSAINRDQVRDCTNILSKAVPLVIRILMDNPDSLWGDPVYPVIEDDSR